MKLFLALAMLLAGCAVNEMPAPVAGNDACSADKTKVLVGRPATQELGSEALALSGARSIRWIGHGQAVTMDYREDRLNISLDAANTVERVSCG